MEASIEGAGRMRRTRERATARDAPKSSFPLPALGKGDLTLVIQARADSGKDEIRFAMRSKPKAPPAGAAS